MIFCAFDIETSGIDSESDVILEMAYTVRDIDSPRELCTESNLVFHPAYPSDVWDRKKEIHGITKTMSDRCGIHLENALARFAAVIAEVDYVVAHNGENFDKPFLLMQCFKIGLNEDDIKKAFTSKPWIDTRFDPDYSAVPGGRSLSALCAHYHIPNRNAHAALSDVFATADLFQISDPRKTIERAKEPWIWIRALVQAPDRESAKEHRFHFEKLGLKRFKQCWIKKIKKSEWEAEQSRCPFPIDIIEEENSGH